MEADKYQGDVMVTCWSGVEAVTAVLLLWAKWEIVAFIHVARVCSSCRTREMVSHISSYVQ